MIRPAKKKIESRLLSLYCTSGTIPGKIRSRTYFHAAWDTKFFCHKAEVHFMQQFSINAGNIMLPSWQIWETLKKHMLGMIVSGNMLWMYLRGVEWSLKNDGSRQILHESRNLGVSNKSLRISGSQKIRLNLESWILQIEFGDQAKEPSEENSNKPGRY